jgi:hypothetical protein
VRRPEFVKPGEFILIDDGKIEVRVDKILNDTDVEATVITGGILKSKKGFNLPHTDVSFPSLTEKDIRDLEFGLENDIEWIGLSFVRKAEDIIDLKNRIKAAGKISKVVAKIEKPEAVKNIDSIKDYHGGPLLEKINLYQKLNSNSNYTRKLAATYKKIKSLGIENPLDYELHIPMVMEKEKLKQTLQNNYQFLWRSIYGNVFIGHF